MIVLHSTEREHVKMDKIRIGGFNYSWHEIDTDFKYAKEISKGIDRASEYGINNYPVLKYIDANKLCFDTFNDIVASYTDEKLLEWFRSKIRNGQKISLNELDIPECVTDYANEIMHSVIKQKQDKFMKLVATI